MQENDEDFSFKNLFVPLTTFKAINIIVIIGLLVFCNMLFNGFVWDDKTYIMFNPDFKEFNLLKLLGANLFNSAGQYRPIPALYFASLYGLFGGSTFVYHIIQLGLHIINSCLLFFLFKKFFNKQISLFLSMLFLTHPIQVESVSYISATVSPLFFFFGTTALLLSIGKVIHFKKMFLICGLLLLSIFTKETGILFLMLIPLYRAFFNEKKYFLVLISGFIAILVSYLCMRFGLAGIYFTTRELAPIDRLTFFQRLINIPSIVFYYIKTFFFPQHLTIAQLWTVTSPNFKNFYIPLFLNILFFLSLGLLGGYTYIKSKKNFRIFLFFFLWLMSGITMHLQIFPLDWTVADRWFYFPIVGVLGILGVGLQSIKFFKEKFKIILYCIAIFILLILSTRTIMRNIDWNNAITLYSHDSRIEDNYDIEMNLGVEYFRLGQYQEALKYFKKSAAMFPNEGNLHNIALSFEKTGDMKAAKDPLIQCVNIKDSFLIKHRHLLECYTELAYIFLLEGDFVSARNFIKTEAIIDYPDSAILWGELAVSEQELQNHKEALIAVEKALSLSSDHQTKYLYNQILNNQPIKLK